MTIPSNVANLYKILAEPLVLFPCVGKKPLHAGWRKLTVDGMTPRQLAKLAKCNIGLAAGEPSCGCCALDIDTAEGLKSFLAMVPAAESWPRLVGARGAKLFVRIEGDYPGKHALTLNGKQWGDWVSTGAQAIVHGMHPDTKKPYQWTVQTAIQTIPFSSIKDALFSLKVQRGGVKSKRLSPASNTTTTNHSSESCILNSAFCALDTASCALYNKPDPKAIVAAIESQAKMRGLVGEKLKPLEKLYCDFIEQKVVAAAGHRNGFLVEAIPFLVRCVSPAVALELAMMFYHTHRHLFHDPPDQHQAEAAAMIASVGQTYLSQLQNGERLVFEALDELNKGAFRICRDLAYRPESQTPLVFFMACNELGARLHTSDMQAFRLLRGFERLGIISTVEKGERRQPGKRPKASSYRWCLEHTSIDNQTNEGRTE